MSNTCVTQAKQDMHRIHGETLEVTLNPVPVCHELAAAPPVARGPVGLGPAVASLQHDPEVLGSTRGAPAGLRLLSQDQKIQIRSRIKTFWYCSVERRLQRCR